jgi:hypothetical protein
MIRVISPCIAIFVIVQEFVLGDSKVRLVGVIEAYIDDFIQTERNGLVWKSREKCAEVSGNKVIRLVNFIKHIKSTFGIFNAPV